MRHEYKVQHPDGTNRVESAGQNIGPSVDTIHSITGGMAAQCLSSTSARHRPLAWRPKRQRVQPILQLQLHSVAQVPVQLQLRRHGLARQQLLPAPGCGSGQQVVGLHSWEAFPACLAPACQSSLAAQLPSPQGQHCPAMRLLPPAGAACSPRVERDGQRLGHVLAGAGGAVREDAHQRVAPQRVALGQRLGVGYIQHRARQLRGGGRRSSRSKAGDGQRQCQPAYCWHSSTLHSRKMANPAIQAAKGGHVAREEQAARA